MQQLFNSGSRSAMILKFNWILMYSQNKIYEFSLENVLSDYSDSTIINCSNSAFDWIVKRWIPSLLTPGINL